MITEDRRQEAARVKSRADSRWGGIQEWTVLGVGVSALLVFLLV